MAMVAADAELKRHQEIWHSFTRFVLWGAVGVTILVILMAIFLV